MGSDCCESRFYTIPTVYNISEHLHYQRNTRDKFDNDGLDYEFGYAGCEDVIRNQDRSIYFPSSLKNLNKNRYNDVLALENTRVRLHGLVNDYINGNYVPGNAFQFENSFNWIMTQGPLQETTPEFWYMIFQENVPLIIMLCKTIENRRPKCHHYWPHGIEVKTFKLQAYKEENGVRTIVEKVITVKKIMKNMKERDIIERKFSVTMDGIEKVVSHLQYTGWPDHGVPSNVQTFRTLMERVRPVCLQGTNIVVHCSAGIGRTGTFISSVILKEKLLHHIQNNTSEYFDFEVFETVKQLRSFRTGSVQQKSQYEFIYHVLEEEAKALGYVPPKQNTQYYGFMEKTSLVENNPMQNIREYIESVLQLTKEKHRRFFIGLAGVPSSGKSTLTNAIRKTFPQNVACITMDGFHIYKHALNEHGMKHRGAFYTFDVQKLYDKLKSIQELGTSCGFPSFAHEEGDPVEDAIQVLPNDQVVIVEGLYMAFKGELDISNQHDSIVNAQYDETHLQTWSQVYNLFDDVLYIDIPLDVAFQRLKARHMEAWNISEGEAMERIECNDSINAKLVVGTRNNAKYLVQCKAERKEDAENLDNWFIS